MRLPALPPPNPPRPPLPPRPDQMEVPHAAQPDTAVIPDAALREELAKRERVALERAAEDIRAAVRDDPALAELARQLVVEQVPEGLRIQILDAERRPMFATGSAAPNERARALMRLRPTGTGGTSPRASGSVSATRSSGS